MKTTYSLLISCTSYSTLFAFIILFCTTAFAQPPAEPIVSRERMRLKAGDEVVDTVDRGELLSVLEELEDAYVVITSRGKRGVVHKAYAARLSEAVEVYDKLIEQNATEGRLYALRANAWWARGEATRALEDFNRSIEAGYEQGYSGRGSCLAALGRHDEAISDHSYVLKIDPENEAAFINRAAVYMAQQKFAEALKDYSEAIGLNGKRASTFQQRAVAWKQVGIFDKAIEDFGMALKLNPDSVPALMGRGYLWFQTDEPERAVADFTLVLKINPKEAQAYNNRGFNYRLLGDYQRALADFDQAVQLNPDYALAHQNKAWLLASAPGEGIRDGKRAVAAASKACELNNYKDGDDLKALAAAFAEAGQFDKAVGWQEKVVDLAPEEEKSFEEGIAKKYRAKEQFRLSDAADTEETGTAEKTQGTAETKEAKDKETKDTQAADKADELKPS